MRFYVETDPAETESWCWVGEVGRLHMFFWWRRGPRFTTYLEPKQ